MNSEGKEMWPRRSPCCTPESDQIKFPLAIRGVGEPYANSENLWAIYQAFALKNISSNGVEYALDVQF